MTPTSTDRVAFSLRQRAQQRLLETGELPLAPASPQEVLALLHELQLLRIERQLQEEDLAHTRSSLQTCVQRFGCFFDSAPLGYYTLDQAGAIIDVNLTGASFLGIAAEAAIGRQLEYFIAREGQAEFRHFLREALAGKRIEPIEIGFGDGQTRPFYVHIQATPDVEDAHCRVTVIDISKLRNAEQRAQELLHQNRLLTRRMFKLQEIERRHLALELHDELGQWLTVIQAEAEAIFNREPGHPAIQGSARSISQCALKVHEVIRRILHRLRPTLLDTLGLADSLCELVAVFRQENPGTACQLSLSGDLGGFHNDFNITVYRIVQEALNNVVKHARASKVAIHIDCPEQTTLGARELRLSVEDNGQGMRGRQGRLGFGLTGMRERVIAADGLFAISSPEGSGVRIDIRLPVVLRSDNEDNDHDAANVPAL